MAKEPKEKSYRSDKEDKQKKTGKKAESETAKSKEVSETKKEEKRDESVILMGPAHTEEEGTMKPIADVLPDLFEEDSFEHLYEEMPAIESKEESKVESTKHKLNFGRFFLGTVLVFVGLVYLGENLELFNIVSVNILELWPLFLIILGLSVLFSRGRLGKLAAVVTIILTITIGLGIALGGVGIVNQLSGNVIEEKRDVAFFTDISLIGAGRLIIEQGAEQSLIVRADENIIENVRTEVSEGELKLEVNRSLTSSLLYGNIDPTYIVTVVELDKVNVIGSGSIQGDFFRTDKLEFSISGSGDIQMKVEADEIISRIFGSGTYILSGNTTRQIVHITGSGSYNAGGLSSKEAGVRISGSGEALISVIEELNASVEGSGGIKYIGNPFVSEESIHGSGVIEKINNYNSNELGNFEILEKLKKIDAVKYPNIEQI